MARGNPEWGQNEPVPWRYRIRGKNPSGHTVTLGCYRTKEEAIAHCEQLAKEGYYKKVKVDPF